MTGRPIRVLHVITRLIVGGAPDNVLVTAEKHRRDRYCVHLAGNGSGEWAARAARVADAFHPIAHLGNALSPREDGAALVELVRLMRRERYDLVHTHSSKAGVLGRIAARIAGVPHVDDYARTDEDRQLFGLIFGAQSLGRIYAAPPEMPAERMKALRRAFAAAMDDAQLLAEAKAAQIDIVPNSGEEVAAQIARHSATPREIVERARRAFDPG